MCITPNLIERMRKNSESIQKKAGNEKKKDTQQGQDKKNPQNMKAEINPNISAIWIITNGVNASVKV